MKARVTSNPYNLGNGWYNVGQIVEIERETAHYYVLVKSSYRINKEKMALTGWAGRYAHSIEFEIIEEGPTVEADPVPMNTEILIATDDKSSQDGARRIVAETLGSLGPVSKVIEPISEHVARLYARLPVGVAVREALDLLYPLEFVITAYPLGAQDMIPDNPTPAVAPADDPADAQAVAPADAQADAQADDPGNMMRVLMVVPSVWNGQTVDEHTVRVLIARMVSTLANPLFGVHVELAISETESDVICKPRAVLPSRVRRESAALVLAEALDAAYPKPVPAPAPKLPRKPYSARFLLSESWNGRVIDLDQVRAFLAGTASEEYSGCDLSLAGVAGHHKGANWVGVEVSSRSGVDPDSRASIETDLMRYLSGFMDESYPLVEVSVVRLSVPRIWKNRKVDRKALRKWRDMCARQWGDQHRVVLAEPAAASLDQKITAVRISGPECAAFTTDLVADAAQWLKQQEAAK